MPHKSSLWYKFAALLLVLALLLPILAACGEEEEKIPTPTLTTTPTPTATPSQTATPTPTPTPSGPVKIGAIMAWTGTMAMAGVLADQVIAVVEDQVKKRGGILGGRDLQIIKQDSRSALAYVLAGWTKLALENKVSLVIFGGTQASEVVASTDMAEKYKILYVNFAPYPVDLTERPYTIRSTSYATATEDSVEEFVLTQLKPKTVAMILDDDAENRKREDALLARLEAAGVKVVSYQLVPPATTDLSPYLSRAKYANPDLLLGAHASEEYIMTTFKQIMELGGWGDMKYLQVGAAGGSPSVTRMPGAEGAYLWALWVPGLPYPAAKKFEQDYMEKHGRMPGSTHAFFYFTLWTAIHAIELAGTDDPAKVAEAARSGKLQWDSPSGPCTIGTDGETNLKGHMVQVGKGGNLIVVSGE